MCTFSITLYSLSINNHNPNYDNENTTKFVKNKHDMGARYVIADI